MSDEKEEKTSVSAETPLGKLAIHGANINLLFTIAGTALAAMLSFLVLAHREESKETVNGLAQEIRWALKGLHQTNQEMLQVQREQLCILSLPPDKREQELREGSWCKRIAR